RDNMGQFCSTCTTADTQIVQELPQAAKNSGTPVYWNNTVYFTATHSPVYAYTLLNGTLVAPASVQSGLMAGGGHAFLTANGNSNWILWDINGKTLYALDAITLRTLYYASQAANGRDVVSGVTHFATPIAADGKVFLGAQANLVTYGLFGAARF